MTKPAPSDDRIVVTLVLALVVHALVILGVSFVKPDTPRERASTLDVVLVQTESDSEPEDARLLAQANQDGGGEHEIDARPSTPLPAPLVSRTAEIVSAAPPVPRRTAPVSDTLSVPSPQENPMRHTPLVHLEPEAPEPAPRATPPTPRPRPERVRRVVKTEPETAPAGRTPAPPVGARTLVKQSLAYASLNAEVNQRRVRYASRPRQKWISARTRASKYAAYMDAWRAKVERIGNLNYPDAARRERLSGTLLLDVAINTDGSVGDIVLRRSSGYRILDDAAIRIVKLAAPFAPLPAGIRKDTDILHIERTWQFLASNRLRSR